MNEQGYQKHIDKTIEDFIKKTVPKDWYKPKEAIEVAETMEHTAKEIKELVKIYEQENQ